MNSVDKLDIFDRLMGLPVLNKFVKPYKRYKEVLLYLFFGGLTTIISIISFAICLKNFGINELISNVISWILAVLFAYITNKIWVFQGETRGVKELIVQMGAFFAGRLFTLVVEEIVIFVFITKMGMNSMLIKIAAQILIIILNYIISKLIVFRKRK